MDSDNNMMCDICHHGDLNEVLILRKDKFTKKGESLKKRVKRVCYKCIKQLILKGKYDCGDYWKRTLLSVNWEGYNESDLDRRNRRFYGRYIK